MIIAKVLLDATKCTCQALFEPFAYGTDSLYLTVLFHFREKIEHTRCNEHDWICTKYCIVKTDEKHKFSISYSNYNSQSYKQTLKQLF